MIYTNKITNHKLENVTTKEKVAKKLDWTITFKESEIEQSDVDYCYYEKGFAPMKSGQQKLMEARSAKKHEAEQALTAKIAEITPYYPTDEKVSFAKQEEEALKYRANPQIAESEIPCIAGIAKGRQITLDLLVQKILAKAALFSKMSGYYMGLKQRIEDLADEAQTIEEIEAIDVTAIFSEIPN